MLYGVDVHDGYQAGLSFPVLAAQGYSFAAVKLTQGTTYARDRGDDWVRAARAAGLIPGGYHWLNNEPGATQARWFYRKVVESGGPQGMLIQCDNEDNATVQVTRDWAAEWAQLSGGHPFLMYTGAWWWQPHLGAFRGADLTPYLWHSRYLSADADSVPDDPAEFAARIPASWWIPGYGGWPTATILQFTSKGDAGTLANNVDLNAFRGSRADLLKLTGAGTTAPPTRRNGVDMFLAKLKTSDAITASNGVRSRGMTSWPSCQKLIAGGACPPVIVADSPAELADMCGPSDAEVIASIVDSLAAKFPAGGPGGITREDITHAVREAFAHGLATG